jgi:Transposase and inactivated derivatives
VKREGLTWLADNPFYTKRFAWLVGRRCRSSTIKDVAQELQLNWDTVKELEKQYMREQLRRVGTPAPRVIGIDEISIGPGHTYRIVVSDLLRRRPIWFGGKDNSEESMDLFYQEWGVKKTRNIYLAVMDMWKPFRTVTLKHVPTASILFDKFHVVSHLGAALDTVRKERVCPSNRPGAPVYQRTEIHAALQPRQSHADGPPFSGQAAPGQPPSEHRLSAQGIFWSIMELRE